MGPKKTMLKSHRDLSPLEFSETQSQKQYWALDFYADSIWIRLGDLFLSPGILLEVVKAQYNGNVAILWNL